MARSIIPVPGEGLQFIFVDDSSGGSLVQIKASVATYNDLPTSGNAENDLRITQDTDRMYTWSIASASGNLSDWQDIGQSISLDWAAITGKPSSSVADIDAAVQAVVNLSGAINVYVDNQRTDSYTEDGSINRPYKTVQLAIDSISDASFVKIYTVSINPGVYDEAITCKDYVFLKGLGTRDSVILSYSGVGSTITMGSGNLIEFQNLRFGGLTDSIVQLTNIDAKFINCHFEDEFASPTELLLFSGNQNTCGFWDCDFLSRKGNALHFIRTANTVWVNFFNCRAEGFEATLTNLIRAEGNTNLIFHSISLYVSAGQKTVSTDANVTTWWGRVRNDNQSNLDINGTLNPLLGDVRSAGDLFVKSGGKISDGTDEAIVTDIKDAVDKKHTQNTDTGTTSETFAIDSDSSGFSPVKIKNESGIISARNNADNAYVDFKAKNIEVVDGEFTGEIGNASNKADANTILTSSLEYVLDGGISGIAGDLQVPFDCDILEVVLLADQTGSIVVDIWKDNYANFPPTVADTITASAKPTISSGVKDEDNTLTGWTKTISAGDILRFNVDSITTIERCTVIIKVRKT